MRNLKRISGKAVSVTLTILMLISIIPFSSFSSHAATNYYYKTSSTGQINYVASIASAWSNANGYSYGVAGILADTTCNTLEVTKGRNITLELNGHVLNRGRFNSSSKTDYNVLSVTEGSTLTVYGNTKATPNISTSHSVNVWNGSSTASRTFYGGVITGGCNTHNGGGINVEESGTLNLHYTRVVGNRADDSAITIGGYGGGIALRGDYAKVNLYNSTIAYNYCEVGGGICVRDAEYAKVYMENSEIKYNTATKEGGGVATSGSSKNFKIEGDGDGDSSTSTKSDIWNNTSAKEGAGIYVECENTVIKGFDIDYNKSSSKGGGIYLPKEKATVKDCYIYGNTATGTGGGISNHNDNNTLENITVRSNSATGNGDGIYNYGLGNIALSGKCIIKNNGTQNLYLDYADAQDEHYIKNSLSKGSEVYITYGSSHPAKLTDKAGTYDASFFKSDTSNLYFHWSPRDDKNYSAKDRNIYRVDFQDASTPSTVSRGRKESTSYTVNSQPVYKGVFEFPASIDDTIDREASYFYSDGYFMGNTSYNEHLATMSANMCMAAMYSSIGGSSSNSAEYRDKSNNFRQLMSDIGCKDEDIYVNDNNVKRPAANTIGCGIASKELPDGKKLVIIGVRGAGYEAEWASNVSIGSSGEANGFKAAAEEVFDELKAYLSRKGIDGSKAKFWISGYSRAGATANLTAKRIIDAYDSTGARTFAYPIEAPKGALKTGSMYTTKYNCIHNVLNYCDIVPWVAPAGMGFARYGTDHYVPGDPTAGTPLVNSGYDKRTDNTIYTVGSSSYQTQKFKMLDQLKAMNDDIIYDDYFHMATINYVGGAVTSNFIAESSTSHSGNTNMHVETWLPKFWSAFQAWGFDYDGNASTTDKSTNNDWQASVTAGSTIRSNYSTKVVKSNQSFQQSLAYVMELMFSMEPEKKEKLLGCVDGLVDRIGVTKLLGIYTNFINTSFSGLIGSSDYQTGVVDPIWNALTTLSVEDEAKGYHSINEYLTYSELQNLKNAFPSLLYPILEFVAQDYKGYSQDHAGTLGYNAMRLIQNHYPEVAVSWMRSYDSYYNSETSPVTLSSKEAPHYPAVEIEHVSGSTTTTEDTSNVIKVRSADKVKLVPNDSSYKDKGEGIYYNYSTNSVWHGYSDPFVFGEISSSYAKNNIYTINTFSAHHDKAANGTKTTGMTSAFDSTKRAYKFQIEDYSEIAYPTSYTGTYPGGYYSYDTTRINPGNTYTTLTGKKPDNTNTWKFDKWTVYPYKNNAKDGSAIADSLLTTYFGGTFNASSETTEVTNLTNKDYLFEPSYTKVIDNETVTLSDGDLPSKASLSKLGISDIPVTWQYDAAANEFTASFSVTLPDKTELNDPFTATFSGFDTNNITYKSYNWNINGNTVHINAKFNCVKESLKAAHAISVVPVDRNVGTEIEGAREIYNVPTSGTGVDISAPTVANKIFIGWRYDSNINTAKTEANSKTLSMLNGTQIVLITDSVINVKNTEGLSFQPFYIPIVNNVTVKLDKNVTAGDTMPTLSKATVNVGSEWEIHNVDCEWTPGVDENAAYDTEYTASYIVDKSTLTGSDLDDVRFQNINLEGMFEFADNVTVTIKDTNENTIPVQATSFDTESDPSKLIMNVVFNKTEKPKIEEFDKEFTVNAQYKESSADITAKLPASVNATLSDGTFKSIPINWNNLPSFTDKLSGQELTVSGTINTDIALASGLTDSVTAKINILPADSVQAPSATPVSGTYEGSTNVTLTSEEGATIYYTYTTKVKEEQITKIVEGVETVETILTPDFTDAPSYKVYDKPIEITKLDGFEAGKEIYISTYASKTDKNDSASAVFTYTVNALSVEEVSPSSAKIAVDGVKQNCYRLLKTVSAAEGEEPQALDPNDSANYRYFSDPHGFNEIIPEEVLDPAFIKAVHTIDASEDTGFNYFGFDDKTDYSALDLLGVQKKADGEQGEGTSDLRFVTAVDSRILKNAQDYGYIIAKLDGNYNIPQVRNLAAKIEYNTQGVNIYTCKGKDNNLSGDYGNTVFTEGEGYTPYKYVTAKITGIDPAAENYVLLARFYIRDEDGNLHYAHYNTSYDGCAANYYKLDHPDLEPDPTPIEDPDEKPES